MRKATFLIALACLAQDAPRTTGWVVIPVPEYTALRGRAFPLEAPPPTTPVEATLTRVDYDLRVKGAVVTGKASLTIDVLKDGWVKVAIPPGLLVREARMEGKPVSLVNGAAVLSRKGPSELVLDVALAVNTSNGEERVVLPASGSGVTRANLSVARPDVEVKVAGGILADQSEGAWLAYGRGNEPLAFSWKRKDTAAVPGAGRPAPLRMRGSLVELVGLGEDSTSIAAEVNLEVTQGSAQSVKVRVPEGVTINQVPGATVADWDLKNGELRVTFLEPAEKTARFVVNGETKLARDGAIAIPLLRLEDVERETGGVAVEVQGAGEITEWKPQGLETAQAADLGQTVAARQSPSMAAFRLRAGAQARSLNVSVARYAQQAVLTANVEEARYRVLLGVDGKTLVQARYAVRNNQRNFVKLTLPAGAVLWSSSLGDKPARPGKAPDGGLLFPLEKGRAGEEAPVFAIEVLYLARGDAWTDRGRASLTLPALDLPVSRTGVVVHYPPLYRATAEPGAFRAQEFARPESAVLTAAVPKTFPAVGPSMFLMGELTGENQAPRVALSYQKQRGRGPGVGGRGSEGGVK